MVTKAFERLPHTFGARKGSLPAGTPIQHQSTSHGVRVDVESVASGSGCGHPAFRCRRCGLTVCERMLAQHPANCEGPA